ncbi:polysaccharide deacetylase family protein [Paenarthrobacter aurescens]|uniref:polysaccharide deacetylase family protein n=1 Tax=Paenarthrobacter aurescens TaxID=43663 RepID=UPI003567D931
MQRLAPVRSPFTIPLVVIVLFLSACVPFQGQPGQPGQPGQRIQPGQPGFSAPIAVIGPAPSRIDPRGSALQGSIIEMTTRTAGPAPTVATWQYISGAEAFNNRLDDRLLGIFDARAGGRHQAAALPATPGALVADGVSITHELVLAAGSVVGSRFVQTTMNDGVRTGLVQEVTYEDLTTGAVTSSAALINPAMTGSLRAMLGNAISPVSATSTPAPAATLSPSPAATLSTTPAATLSTTPAATLSTTPAPAPGSFDDAALLTAVVITPDGNLSVTIQQDPGTGSPLPRPLAVRLNAEATADVLSPGGQALRAAVIGAAVIGAAVISAAPFKAPQPSPDAEAHINCDLVACAALTYDDRPNAQTTRLLAILAKHKVLATFFQQGGYVRASPSVAKAVATAGHTIGNHTMSHPNLSKLPPAGIAAEVQGATNVIEAATGTAPAYVRPPYGATNSSVAASVGLPQILWDVDSLDWQSRNKAVFIPRIMNLVKPGSIILLHDVHASTVDGQAELITRLKGKGFHLVTLPQLFKGIELKPGASYKCRGTAPGCVAGR